jgi:D-amino-acid dehydrogenase
MACGSGRLLADLMAKKTPQISAEGLDISRYGKKTQESAKHVNPAPAHQ